MAQQTPDPKLIESMALRYRHDFWLLDELQKEPIRTTMKQLWEEVVGLGFYKPRTAQQTAMEQFIEWISSDCTPLDCVIKAKELLKTEREQRFKDFKAGQDSMEEGGKGFEQYYTQTYGK